MLNQKSWKRVAIALFCLFVAPQFSTALAEEEESFKYPLREPLRKGHLEVSEIHSLYWEVCGKEDGIPVIVLHGGPGGGAWPPNRRLFDPDVFMTILFDQRGAGRSRPKGEWRENNTQLLIEDINTLRDHLGITEKAVLFGGSWGSTLAVAYAEAYPDKVSALLLRGVFLASKAEIDHFYHGGAGQFYPKNYQRLQAIVPHPEKLDYPRQLFEMTQSEDPKVREKAIKGWAFYEIRMCKMDITDARCREIVDEYDMTAFSVLENYYMQHNCFLAENQLLNQVERIAHIPAFIVNGRFDAICPPATAFALAEKLDEAELVLTLGSHSRSEPENLAALIRGVEWIAERVE